MSQRPFDNNRPLTMAGMLNEVARTLDHYDAESGVDTHDMQDDLRALAEWYRVHTGIDAQLHGSVFGQPDF